MKIFMHTDLEGAARVCRWFQTRASENCPEQKHEAMEYLTGEVNATVEGILEAEPEAEVIIWDGHGSGGLIPQDLHREAKLLNRAPIDPPYTLDETYDAMFFVGQHAMAGTEDANLCHTYSSTHITHFRLNGTFVGEFGARSVLAGSFGIPTVFISGDDRAVAEARELCPSIHGAVVKWSHGEELAVHLSHIAAKDKVKKIASRAVRHVDSIQPITMDPPYELEIRVKEGHGIGDHLEQGAKRVDERTVLYRSDDICDLPV
ncbi:MAG: M55 family metallopeptidase [Planctomycetota bacterium]